MRRSRRTPTLLPIVLPLFAIVCLPHVVLADDDAALKLTFRSREATADKPEEFTPVKRALAWQPARTAVVICDMWDKHWCSAAEARVGEMAPRMNDLVNALRKRGVLILHCPSETMAFYLEHPARRRAIAAPRAEATEGPDRKAGPFPFEVVHGGCDDESPQQEHRVWSRQIDKITIDDGDAITDSGDETVNLLKQRGIENVLMMGVHTNMCVLHRPFAIKALVRRGFQVALVRDMTDSMYSPKGKPHVDHFTGNDLVVEWIEKYWCPTISSDQLLGGKPFRFADDKRTGPTNADSRASNKSDGEHRPHLVIIAAEDEYKTELTLPKFVERHLADRFSVSFVFAEKDCLHSLSKLDVLEKADLALFSIRRRVLPKDQLAVIRKYLESGKPLVAIRTTSHAFASRDDDAVPDGHEAWAAFDREVLGCRYEGHYGEPTSDADATRIRIAAAAAGHPILKGLETKERVAAGSLYKSRDLAKSTTVLLTGRNGGNQEEPVAWTHVSPWNGKVFYTSLGHPQDFDSPDFQRLLLNAILWAADPSKPETPQEVRRGLSPEESAKRFQLPDDLEMELVLAEPIIAQPLHLSFDERGRMWVVEYRQYPMPAGLKIVSRDNYWRAVYDKVPPAPPHHDRGQDRVSIHEDTDGDGRYDKHTNFVDGLNIATSVACGRGGVWVLNPPYLLFYADRDRNDVPDSDPVVHLSGFGIEDTHSCANSLRFGPDGWLYGAHGSTVTCNIRRVGLDPAEKPGVQCQGQMLWRYHPESRRFEIFAEGGGNAFGLDIDSQGRMFSGHNGGDTRGFHYVQGGYLQKGFSKHGPLSNPYAFGFFPAMQHDRVPRFTHEFTIYGGGALPEKYHGRMFGVAPLLNYVSISDVKPRGSTFATADTGFIQSTDTWFRPVDITVGPDGNLYVADWYDEQCSHVRNSQGEMEAKLGRVYRLKTRGGKSTPIGDLAGKSSAELLGLLTDRNIWLRQTVLRILGDRREKSVPAAMEKALFEQTGQPALETLWALHQSAGLSEAIAKQALDHADPFVRLWTVRLLADERQVSSPLLERIIRLAREETDVEVRAQLACSARRLPATNTMAIVRELVGRTEDTDDLQIPLLVWWAIEAHCGRDSETVLALFNEPSIWSHRMVQVHLLSRLMQRFASSGKRSDLLLCTRLLNGAPPEAVGPLMNGFEAAYRGRTPSNLPKELAFALAKTGSAGLPLRVRLAEPAAVAEALSNIVTGEAPIESREELITVLGEIREKRAVPPLLEIALNSTEPRLRRVALSSLGSFDDEQIGSRLIAAHASLPPDLQPLAQNLLASRAPWSLALVRAVEAGTLDGSAIPAPIIKKMLLHNSTEIAGSVKKLWGDSLAQSAAAAKTERARLENVVAAANGSPYEGKKLFRQSCGKCHTLFSDGGQVGPDLTSYNREQVGNILQHVVDPNAEIREGFETYAVVTSDGRALSGFLADQDAQVVLLRGFNGESTTVPRDEIESMQSTGQSLMPEGLLKEYTETQVRDLFAYLRSTQPLND